MLKLLAALLAQKYDAATEDICAYMLNLKQNLNQCHKWKVDLQNGKLSWKRERDKIIYKLVLQNKPFVFRAQNKMNMIKVKVPRSKDWKFSWENSQRI